MHIVPGLDNLVYVWYLMYLASQVTICWLLAGLLELAKLPPVLLKVVQCLSATAALVSA